jgi:plastocyanin
VLSLAPAVLLLAAAAAPAPAYEVAPVTDGGTLTGLVRFAATAPRPPALPVSRRHDACGDEAAAEALVVGADRGVRDGVVLLEGVARGKKPEGELVLETRHCLFAPHVTATMAGERVHVKNGDGLVHNPQGLRGRTAIFNVALPGREQTIDVTRRLTGPGVVRVVCGAHPHMAAWIVVHDSPYVAVSDERGAFRIDGIPPGRYRVTLWHAGYRARGLDKDGRALYEPPHTVTKDVRIGPRATATVDFELK